jgi:hypothetical protein
MGGVRRHHEPNVSPIAKVKRENAELKRQLAHAEEQIA